MTLVYFGFSNQVVFRVRLGLSIVTFRVGATKGVLLFIVELHERKLINKRITKWRLKERECVCW